MSQTTSSSVSEQEIARFGQLARDWWAPQGPMRPLHDMNPLRTRWVEERVRPLQDVGRKSLRLLDIGCGAGLASEAFAKFGFEVCGLDASPDGIEAARAHVTTYPLPAGAGDLSYRCGSAEELCAEKQTFDVVTALEVIEHVTDPQQFMHLLASLTRPGGMVCVSTMNRTLRALAVAKIGAEYIARLLPKGTHDWKKFIKPEELAAMGRAAGLRMTDIAGMSFTPTMWRTTRDTSINYIAMFTRG